MLAQGERSPLALVERLDALAEILRNKEDDKEAKLVLSTIHSSKGLNMTLSIFWMWRMGSSRRQS